MSPSESPLVSVVIPVYNGEEFLSRAIRSVLEQTHSNLELTIVNNRSSDGTLAIAERAAAEDERVRIHNNSEFLSVVANHNMAFSLVS